MGKGTIKELIQVTREAAQIGAKLDKHTLLAIAMTLEGYLALMQEREERIKRLNVMIDRTVNAWESRCIEKYAEIKRLNSAIDELINVGNALDNEIETAEIPFYVLSEEILKRRVDWEKAVTKWKEREE